jgi:hypothetical protein
MTPHLYFTLKISADLFGRLSAQPSFENLKNLGSEPEFLKILKCNLAESAGAGFQFNCYDIFNDKTLNLVFGPLIRSVKDKSSQKSFFLIKQKL